MNNAKSELIALSFDFESDANVADRFLRVIATHGPYPIVLGGMDRPIVANQTRHIIVGQHGVHQVADSGDVVYIPIPSFPFLLEGDTITIDIINVQVGDQIKISRHCMKTWVYEQ